jgi:hypothetical protein
MEETIAIYRDVKARNAYFENMVSAATAAYQFQLEIRTSR